MDSGGDILVHIEGRQLKKNYDNGRVKTEVLKGVDISIEKGEFVGIMGQSGSGKSTLLHILGALETPTYGEVKILGNEVGRLSDRKKAKIRRDYVGFIFQFFYLIPGLSVYENIILPALISRKKIDDKYVESLLEQVGLAHRKKHKPSQLSGGEQQRLAIARTLVNKPVIILADEPTGNLDSKTGESILRLLGSINKSEGITIAMVTHSKYAASNCSRIISIKDGRVIV